MSYPLSLQAAHDLRTLENLSKYRHKAQCVSREAVLNQGRETLWPLLCHTDFLNQQVGMKTTTNFFMALAEGGSLMHAQAKNGPFQVAYEEFPYIWEAPAVYAVERVFVKGPIHYLQFKVTLEELETPSQTRVKCSIHFVSKIPSALARVVIGQEIDKFMASFQRLARRLDAGEKGLLPFFAVLPEEHLEPLREKWAAFTGVPGLARDLAHYFLCAPERLSYRLRPREFAAWYDHDPLEVLNLCLYLAAQGDLQMHWDCRCPGCKGPKESYTQLVQLKNKGYCASCAVHYGLAFDQNIELTFAPSPPIREVSDAFFCAGSPGNTPHVAWQQIVPAHTDALLQLQVPAGKYILRSLHFTEEKPLSIEPTSPAASLAFCFSPQGLEADLEPLTCAALTLHFENNRDYDVTLLLEDVFWDDLAVTAAQVQCVQMFHDVFPAEALGDGVVLPLSYQVFLEVHWAHEDSELWTWTQFQLGQFQGAMLQEDDAAPSRRWIFASAFDALAAAWSLQAGFADMADFYGETQRLTLTLAAGPCEVQCKGTKLHYAGPALNTLAALNRWQGKLEGHNILVPAPWFAQPEMTVFLTQAQNHNAVNTYRLSLPPAEAGTATDPESCVQFQWEVLHGF